MDEIYKELVDLSGAPGFEHDVREYVKSKLSPYVDSFVNDKLGSIFGIVNNESNGPTLMICAHMDEVGGIITSINKNGTLNMIPLGGINKDVFLSQNMNVFTDNGIIPAVTISIPAHLKESNINFDGLVLDVGADSLEHAKSLGIKLSQQVVPVNKYTITADKKKIISKAWDDRFGCGLVIEIAKLVKKNKLNCKLILGCTVQEEVGLRGAVTSTSLINPDCFITIDCSPVNDSYVDSEDKQNGKLGAGFLMRFYDPRCIMHKGMKLFFEELANSNSIKYQNYRSMGGTDAAAAQLTNSGIPSATLGMPSRYIHSTTSMIHLDDYEEIKKMALKIVYAFDLETLNTIKKNV